MSKSHPCHFSTETSIKIMPNIIRFFMFVFAFCCFVSKMKAEYFSSVDSLQKLGVLEQQLVMATYDYLSAQKQELAKYNKFVQRIKAEHLVATEDIEDYLGNPLKAYSLIKRMVIDWKEMHEVLSKNQHRESFRANVEQIARNYTLPNNNDVIGAVKGLVRLQEVYNLTVEVLAKGAFSSSELNWRDCLEIGAYLFEIKFYNRAISWFQASLRLLEHESDANEIIKLDVYEYMALAYHGLGDKEEAFSLLQMVLESHPTHKAQYTKTYVELTDPEPYNASSTPHHLWYANYTRLCQGKQISLGKPTQQLNCILDSKLQAYFILAPLKVEHLSLDPEITIYHNLLNDEQIESVLMEADDHVMLRSSVAGHGGKPTVRDIRVSQQTWLRYESPVMKFIQRLVGQISGLDMTNAEIMQLANYGIGGLYEPHFDYFAVNLPKEFIGDRISTSMFYFSDVELGGYTVFPHINLYLQPVKGALVMWYNLHRTLDGDVRTLHAGCPVIKGSKRIGNVWIHSGLQEFRRSCGLTPDNYKNQPYLY